MFVVYFVNFQSEREFCGVCASRDDEGEYVARFPTEKDSFLILPYEFGDE